MRRPWLAAVLAAACAAGAFAGGAGEQLPAGVSGTVVFLSGEVSLDGRPAEIGQEARYGATVRTGADGVCEVVFASRNVFRIGGDSVAVLRMDGQNGEVELRSGIFAAVFEKLQYLGGDGFRVKTPTAVAGIRGTAFFIKVEDAANTYVCTCNGRLALADDSGGGSRSVQARHHRAYRFSREGQGVVSRSAGMLYHDDAFMSSLAARIRVRIPWGSSGADGGRSSGY